MVLGSVRYPRSNAKLHLEGPGGSGGKRTLHVDLRISQRKKHRTERMNHVSMYEN